MTSYVIKTEVFEGPLDLLLSLIEKRKLFISDISLAKVADDYIAHIQNTEEFPLAESAHFVLIASTLVLIKSKSLLPTLELTPEEERDISDLENRLKLYQRIKELSKHIRDAFGVRVMFAPENYRETDPVFTPDSHTNTAEIFAALKELLERLPQPEKMAKTVVAKVISLEEMMEDLAERVKKSFKTTFHELTGKKPGKIVSKEEKINMIVGFLAMLELVKQGIIAVRQDVHFADIEMETKDVGTPAYGE